MLTSLFALAFAANLSSGPDAHRTEKLLVAELARSEMTSGVVPKEITPSCLPVPIPTTPSGPRFSFDVNTGTSSRPSSFKGTFWRRPCTGNNAQLILTLEPTTGNSFVCSVNGVLIQNSQQIDSMFFETSPNNTTIDSLCGELFVPTSVVLDPRGASIPFDDDAGFTFIYKQGTTNITANVPAFDPTAYGQPAQDQVISGKLSGSYFDPARSGEGVLVEVGRVGTRKSFFLTWYTYFNGQQRWIVGNVDIPANSTTVTLPMIYTTGGQFGSAFSPSQVARVNWGSATVSFPSCTTMRFAWQEANGQSGSFNYVRLAEGIEGVSCP